MFQEMLAAGSGGGGVFKEGTFTANGDQADITVSDVGFKAKKIYSYKLSQTNDVLDDNSCSFFYDEDISSQHTFRGTKRNGNAGFSVIKFAQNATNTYKEITSNGFVINCGNFSGTIKYIAIG